MAKLDEEGFEVDPRQGRVLQARLRLLKGEEVAEEVLDRGLGGLDAQGLETLGAREQQVPGLFDGPDQEKGPEMLDELAEDKT